MQSRLLQIRQAGARRRNIFIYLGVLFFVYSLWAIILPYTYYAAPDEFSRLKIIDFIANNNALPTGFEAETRVEYWGMSYAFVPYIPQMFGALFLKIARKFTENPLLLFYACRLPSILCGLGTVWFAYLTSDRLFKNNPRIKIFVIAFVSLLPQFVFVSSYINNDCFAVFAATAVVYAWVNGIDKNWDIKSCVILAVTLGVCLLSYYNAFGFIILSVLLWLFVVLKKKENRKNIKSVLGKVALIAAVVLLVAGWWYVRSAVLYDGDVLGMKTTEQMSEQYGDPPQKPSNRPTYKNAGKGVVAMLRENEWGKMTFQSFVCSLGPLKVFLSEKWYDAFKIIIAVGILGFVFGALKALIKRKAVYNSIVLKLALVLGIGLTIFLSIYRSWGTDYQPQGRYVMPILVPLALLMAFGFKSICEHIKPKIIKTIGFYGLISFIVLTCSWSFFRLFDYYY